jgi:copper oxidase (laccase) domain-containing protein
VGEEVQLAFASYGAGVLAGRNLDLRAVARAQLARAGIEHIHDVGLCTSCHPELFFSHRRDRGVTGRQAGVIWPS